MTARTDAETAREFLVDRADWLHVDKRTNHLGTWDVVLVLDSGYPAESDADEMTRWFRRRVANVLNTEDVDPLHD